MKLYVDDIRKEPEGWTLARTINSAINCIIQFTPEEISLDHDISCETRMGGNLLIHSSDECYCAVARFIGVFYKDIAKPKVTLHTGNPGGAVKLERILKDYGIESTTKLSAKAMRSGGDTKS